MNHTQVVYLPTYKQERMCRTTSGVNGSYFTALIYTELCHHISNRYRELFLSNFIKFCKIPWKHGNSAETPQLGSKFCGPQKTVCPIYNVLVA